MTFVLPRSALEDVLAHSREGVPQEVCGLFAGRRVGDRRAVVRHYRVPNVHPRPIGQYLLDPKEQLRLTLEIEDDLGLEVLGFYHSHPIGPARLSTTDEARATWPDAVYFLVWLAPEEGFGAWTWNAERNRFLPEALEVVGSAPAIVEEEDARLRELTALAPFLIDPEHERVHRADGMTRACAGEIDPARVQTAADVLKASLAMKTRHYSPCPRCWAGG